MIPFAKPTISEAAIKKSARILRSGNVSNGRYCRELEDKVKEISGAEHAVAVNSCTTGLWLVQKEMGFFKKKHGLWEKRIAVPAFTWKSTYWNIRNPIWMDCSQETWNVENVLPNFDGAVITQVFGNKWMGHYAINGKMPIIADSAHALGLPYNPAFIAEVYSLAPSKTFTGCEGGVIVTNDVILADNFREEVKWAGRLEEVNALVAFEKLKNWKKLLAEKRKIAHYYLMELGRHFKWQDCNAKFGYVGGNQWISDEESCQSTHNEVGFRFGLKFGEFLQEKLKGKVETRERYKPDRRVNSKKCPNAWNVYLDELNIPSWVGVDYRKVTKLVLQAYKEFEENDSQTMTIERKITIPLPKAAGLPDSKTYSSWSK